MVAVGMNMPMIISAMIMIAAVGMNVVMTVIVTVGILLSMAVGMMSPPPAIRRHIFIASPKVVNQLFSSAIRYSPTQLLAVASKVASVALDRWNHCIAVSERPNC
jgi:hypothetical protein